MSSHAQFAIRPVDADDLEERQFAPLRAVASDDRSIARAAEVAGNLVAVGVIDPNGRATLPHDPALELVILRTAGEIADAVDALVQALIDAAATSGITRLTAGCDPMDVSMLKLLERNGFKPAGTMPYFDLGGGHVQYVTGYQDATGSTMDLVIDLAR